MELISCKVCGRKFKRINPRHIRKHNLSMSDYCKLFPLAELVCKELAEFIANQNVGSKRTDNAKRKMKEAQKIVHKKNYEIYKKNCNTNSQKMKGRTYEELYGNERAKEIKLHKSASLIEFNKLHPEYGEKTAKRNKTMVWTDVMRKKLSVHRKGQPSPFKGIPLSEEHKNKQSKTMREKYTIHPELKLQNSKRLLEWNKNHPNFYKELVKKRRRYNGENNPNWKGLIKETCLVCNRIFEYKRGGCKRKTCSKECCSKLNSERMKKNNPDHNPIHKQKHTDSLKRFFANHPEISNIMSKRQKEWLNNHPEFKEKMSRLAKQRYKGSGNPNWKNGLSQFPYPWYFNQSLKEYIRDKFGRICMNCKKSESEFKHKLDIHHIDHNKDNCKEENLIPLCRKCNGLANSNRKFWQEKYTKIILQFQ